MDNFSSNAHPTTTHPQQGTVSPLFSQTLPPSQQPRLNEDDHGANVRSTGSSHSQQYPQGTVNPSFSQKLTPQRREGTPDNFGSNVRSNGPADSSSTAGGRILTSHVQTRPAGSTEGYSLQDSYSGGRHPKGDSSFPASVDIASHEKFDDLKSETKMSPWVNNQFNDILEPPVTADGTTRRPYAQPTNAGTSRSGSPLPVTAPSRTNKQGPSGLVNQWTNTQEGLSRSSIGSSLSSQVSVYHDALTSQDSENGEPLPKNTVSFSVPPPPATTTMTTTTTTTLPAQNTNEEDSRHVRFGGVEGVDRGTEKRFLTEKVQRAMGTYPNIPLAHILDYVCYFVYTDEWFHFDLGPRGGPRNSEANRTEINRDPPHQATKTQAPNLNENVNNPNNSASRRIPPNTSSLNPYAQTAHQTTPNLPTQQQPPMDMRNIPPPPRLQALNNKPVDSQVPPRFQNSSSSIANPLPPRFSQISAPGGWNF